MMLREELVEYAERSSNLIEDSPQMDEENTKRKVIEPLIETLGWDILSSDVELEYSVQMGSGTKKVDYALKLEGAPVVFVEAKGCDTPLDQSHENQLKSYMRQVGVDWGLLSNGRQFEIFRRDISSTRPNEISLAAFGIETVPNNEHPLKALSHDSIASGESRQIAKKIEAVQEAVQSLRENKETLAEDVTRVVTNVAGNSVSQLVEDQAKNFVDNLIDSLEEQTHREAVTASRDSGGNQNKRREDRKYVIRFLRNGDEIQRVNGDVQSEVVASAVEYLIQEEELTDEIDIPYIPGTGRGNRALINHRPEHPNGNNMKGSKPIAGDFYLLTHMSSDDKIRYTMELADKVGIEPEFIGEW
ncbi:type I restriction enzyme HsdR N-terminal domain-containing protein [Halobellus rubicundus]|uniref:Type I restriction enzyme HsdR N-terminal domain-containing protein n=1 Tax=Halobellus rubicundus TaxID=2996466 RepID=A0ABD5ME71_9EURY